MGWEANFPYACAKGGPYALRSRLSACGRDVTAGWCCFPDMFLCQSKSDLLVRFPAEFHHKTRADPRRKATQSHQRTFMVLSDNDLGDDTFE